MKKTEEGTKNNDFHRNVARQSIKAILLEIENILDGKCKKPEEPKNTTELRRLPDFIVAAGRAVLGVFENWSTCYRMNKIYVQLEKILEEHKHSLSKSEQLEIENELLNLLVEIQSSCSRGFWPG